MSTPPLRVLNVYSGNLFGGIETYLLSVARADAHAEFAICFEGRLTTELRALGARVHVLGPVRTSRPWTVLRARRRLSSHLESAGYDVVVCHTHWSQAIFGSVAIARKVPLVFFLHDAANGTHWIERWASLTRPALTLTNSQYTARTIARTYPGCASAVLHCPVYPIPPSSARDRDVLRRELTTERDSVVIVQVSRLEPYKGHRLHLAALAELRDIAGWTAWFVGGAQRPHEEAYLAELKAFAEKAGIATRLRFLGQRRDVFALLGAADIHCQPNSGPEPFGITFIEALSAGLPAVTTALGGALEIVDDSCGLLVAPEAAAVAGALRSLIVDEQRRARLGANGPARAKLLCDPVAQAEKLSTLLRGVVADARPRARRPTSNGRAE